MVGYGFQEAVKNQSFVQAKNVIVLIGCPKRNLKGEVISVNDKIMEECQIKGCKNKGRK